MSRTHTATLTTTDTSCKLPETISPARIAFYPAIRCFLRMQSALTRSTAECGAVQGLMQGPNLLLFDLV